MTTLNQTANAFLTAVTLNEHRTAADILDNLPRQDLEIVAFALAGTFNGFLRGLAKEYGADPDAYLQEATAHLGVTFAADTT